MRNPRNLSSITTERLCREAKETPEAYKKEEGY